jgi:hypothetical protein
MLLVKIAFCHTCKHRFYQAMVDDEANKVECPKCGKEWYEVPVTKLSDEEAINKITERENEDEYNLYSSSKKP